jgi:hypothetical protein
MLYSFNDCKGCIRFIADGSWVRQSPQAFVNERQNVRRLAANEFTMKEQTMTAYSLSTWYGHPAFLPKESSPVAQLFNRLQSKLPRNLAQMIAGDADGDGETAPAARPSADGIYAAGSSRESLAEICECVAVKHRGRQVLTAVRTAHNGLALISWRVNADGSVIQTGTSGIQPEPVAQIDLARAGKFVVAYRTPAHQARLVSWDVSNTGAIYRAGESDLWPEPVRQVKVQALNESHLVTASISRDRTLHLMSWQLEADAGFTCLHQVKIPTAQVREVALTVHRTTGGTALISTVCRTPAALVVQQWQVDAYGQLYPLAQSTLSLQGTQLRTLVDPQGRLVTALRSTQGRLRLICWERTNEQAGLIPCFDTGEAGPCIRRFGVMGSADGVITATVTAERRLQLKDWTVEPDGTLQCRREGGLSPVCAGPVVLCSEALDGNAPILAGLCPTAGRFNLTTWQIHRAFSA